MSNEECKHTYQDVLSDGTSVEKTYKNIFCPDCGKRLVWDYKAEAFKLS